MPESTLNLLNPVLIIPIDEVVFPQSMVPLNLPKKFYSAVKKAYNKNELIAVSLKKNKENIKIKFHTRATAAVILQVLNMPDESLRILIQGVSRVDLSSINKKNGISYGRINILEEKKIRRTNQSKAMISTLKKLFKKYIEYLPENSDDMLIGILNINSLQKLPDFITTNMDIEAIKKQRILEELDIKKRIENTTLILAEELEILKKGEEIQNRIYKKINKNQKEFFLREQIRLMQEELDDKKYVSDVQRFINKVKNVKLSSEAQEVAQRELNRLKKIEPISPEYTVISNYLDWLTAMPWGKKTNDNIDIIKAERILNHDHYNLKEPKARIIEYLAVRKLNPKIKGSILCFLGAPGVGKTSLGKSIAKTMNRKFIRISLGGVRDEAEIRGHRRTYIGSMPGTIIQNIKKVGTDNPVFMLDEIDKIGTDFRGDPASALLEVLDPEQNSEFVDHYLNIKYDLSNVFFIATANILSTIPSALRDRMEIIELHGYSEYEKLEIAKKFIIPKQLKKHGIKKTQLIFRDSAIRSIILDYTRETGVRNLEREIANTIRKVARGIVEKKWIKKIITEKNIVSLLGRKKFDYELSIRSNIPGIATGLAWTRYGGTIIFIEAVRMPGHKKLKLTGHLGNVMKESAETALSYIRSNYRKFKLADDFIDKQDIHIHIPEGAVPKDGPSAGITIAMALISLFTNKPLKNKLAMTGEISLQGLVLPVGGITEKILAAHRHGIKEVILPEYNYREINDLPKKIQKEIKFHPVKNLAQIIKIAF